MPNEENDAPEPTKFAALPAALVRGSASGSRLPPALSEKVDDLEKWALSNRQEAQDDAARFWAFKVPAILSSATSGLFALLKCRIAGVVASSIASICIVMDGLLRAGMLRGVHIRAFHEIRALESHIRDEWLIGQAKNESENELVARILIEAQDKSKQIEEYVRTAEAGLPETKPK